jgi:hypothetical protein
VIKKYQIEAYTGMPNRLNSLKLRFPIGDASLQPRCRARL